MALRSSQETLQLVTMKQVLGRQALADAKIENQALSKTGALIYNGKRRRKGWDLLVELTVSKPETDGLRVRLEGAIVEMLGGMGSTVQQCALLRR